MSLCGLHQPLYAGQQHTLTRACWSDHRDRFSFINAQGNILQHQSSMPGSRKMIESDYTWSSLFPEWTCDISLVVRTKSCHLAIYPSRNHTNQVASRDYLPS